jgi:hypothetical protein
MPVADGFDVPHEKAAKGCAVPLLQIKSTLIIIFE